MNTKRIAGTVLSSLSLPLAMAIATGHVAAQALPAQARHSTHDWLNMIGESHPNTMWVDVKTPGNGFAYAVGTTEVMTFVPGATLFSDFEVGGFPGAVGFTNPMAAGPRQTVVLQVTDEDQAIVWQQFFYGFPENEPRPSNVRGVSVWADEDPTDTRIAICGETLCPTIPLSQDPAGIPGTATSGFIAVYDGLGELLWTHHFFETDAQSNAVATCAITDVSIRVEGDDDVITYCGISEYGDWDGPQGWLDPVAPFAAPAGCAAAAAGDSDSGTDQWDGIVGRLRNDHDVPTTPAGVSLAGTDFHSIVGGREQDGLFGIAEFDADRFVTVGSTGTVGPVAGPFSFPFTTACVGPMTDESLGTIMIFDASDLAGAGLVLEQGLPIGSDPALQDGRHTVLRDVVEHEVADPLYRFVAVGSTDDEGVSSSWQLSGQATIGGGVDGLVIGGEFVDFGTGSLIPTQYGQYRGGVEDDVLTGVQAWNEFGDVVNITGYTSDPIAGENIEAESLYLATFPIVQLRSLTSVEYGGTLEDRPTVVGLWSATTDGGDLFEQFGLGDPAGGGVAVDETGRCQVVGATVSDDFPITAAPPARMRMGPLFDGVRTVLDLLPVGVGRTDGTGDPGQPVGMPYPPAAPLSGGTTPECATVLFGRRIGEPAPPLRRMQIDWEGGAPAALAGGAVGPTIVVSRPPDDALFLLLAVQFAFPGDAMFQPLVLPEGYLAWTVQNPISFAVPLGAGGWQAGQAMNLQLPALPAGSLTATVQLFASFATPIIGGLPPACGGSTRVVMSPGLWFAY